MSYLSQFLHTIDIVVTGNERPHQISSSANITCSSDLAVQTIRWLNNGTQLFHNSGKQQLSLLIERVTSSLSNTIYTCAVQVIIATGIADIQENITFRLSGEFLLFCNSPFNCGMIIKMNGLLVSLKI